MKRLVLAALIAIAAAAPAWAGLDEGWAAYHRGDYETAFNEWLPLAEQGDAKAQFKLGTLYLNGQGVPQDYVRAHMWFIIGDAKIARVMAAENMTAADISEAERLAQEWIEKHSE